MLDIHISKAFLKIILHPKYSDFDELCVSSIEQYFLENTLPNKSFDDRLY